MTTKQKAFKSLSKLNIDQVKELVLTLNNDFQDGSDNAFDWAMEYLESLMPETEFVLFCDTL